MSNATSKETTSISPELEHMMELLCRATFGDHFTAAEAYIGGKKHVVAVNNHPFKSGTLTHSVEELDSIWRDGVIDAVRANYACEPAFEMTCRDYSHVIAFDASEMDEDATTRIRDWSWAIGSTAKAVFMGIAPVADPAT